MGKKILIADDSVTIQKVIRLALNQAGYEIESVSSGKDFLEKVTLFQPGVVLIDYALPDQDAFSLKKELSQIDDLKKVPFILMSNAFENIDEAQIKTLQFAGHLVKPFDPGHLRELLKMVFQEDKEQEVEKIEQAHGIDLSKAENKPEIAPPPSPELHASQAVSSPSAPSKKEATVAHQEFQTDLWETTQGGGSKRETAIPSASSLSPGVAAFSEKASADKETEPSTGEEIQRLTQATLQKAPLDELGWSVSETSLETGPDKMTPLQEPLENHSLLSPDSVQENLDSVQKKKEDFSSFELEPEKPEQDLSAVQSPPPGPQLEPPKAFLSTSESIPIVKDQESLQNKKAPASSKEKEPDSKGTLEDAWKVDEPVISPEVDEHTEKNTSAQETLIPAQTVSPEEVEKLISQQLGPLVREMAQKILPDLAAQIVKEEIHKMLSSPPLK